MPEQHRMYTEAPQQGHSAPCCHGFLSARTHPKTDAVVQIGSSFKVSRCPFLPVENGRPSPQSVQTVDIAPKNSLCPIWAKVSIRRKPNTFTVTMPPRGATYRQDTPISLLIYGLY